MVLIAVCGLLTLAGLVAIVRWGGCEVEKPWPPPDDATGTPPPREVALRYVWYVTVAVAAGVGAGVLVAGAGGRLAMRLLAATAGDAAQGRVTEAEEIVGRITVDGTIGLVVFTALFFGSATGALYMLIRRWLPRGRLGGLAYAGLLLVLAATRTEPLRRDNPDFDIVGPGWLAVAVFSALVLAHGMLVAALAGRYSRVLPRLSPNRKAVAAHAPLLVLAPMAPVVLPLTLVGAVAVVVSRARAVVAWLRSPPAAVVARAIIAVAVLVTLPGFVTSVVDILGRGPS